jgi:hypothetical protein
VFVEPLAGARAALFLGPVFVLISRDLFPGDSFAVFAVLVQPATIKTKIADRVKLVAAIAIEDPAVFGFVHVVSSSFIWAK